MRDAKEKEHVSRRIKGPDHHPQKQSSRQESSWQERHKKPYQYPQDRGVRNYQPYDSYTPLKETKVHILHEILSIGMTTLPPTRGKPIMLGPNNNAWCAYHRAKGHDTEKCFRLRDLIEELIRSGHLRKFIDDAAQGRVVVPKVQRQDSKEPPGRDEDQTRMRIAVNTIAGGFSGGGVSNNARKRYARSVTHEIYLVWNTSSSPVPDISFTAKDGQGVFPHDDDPLVIQVQILNCDVKRVLIDSGSSADVMYWEAFKVMQLTEEQLQPYEGTLVGFSGEQVYLQRFRRGPFHLILVNEISSGQWWRGNHQGRSTPGKTMPCHESRLKIQHKIPSENAGYRSGSPAIQEGINMVDSEDMDPREEFQDRRVSPIEELEQIQIGVEPHQTTNLGRELLQRTKRES
ncbi:reticuline oxidase-like protein [Trifolium pratense]|uniref:Reticuline oxidase-like protein n=1 Tax=Trifolium pratense TaxID=57577 RepID=A0A2K3M0C9_TRIPR|nr:reticuline oxidase-like protein [Trifolium pratense]